MCLSFAIAGPAQAGRFKGCTGTYLLEGAQGFGPVAVLNFSDDGSVVGQVAEPPGGSGLDMVGNWSVAGGSGMEMDIYDVNSWYFGSSSLAARVQLSSPEDCSLLLGTLRWFFGTGDFSDAQDAGFTLPIEARPFAPLP